MNCDIAIVGAGPAGLNAARTLAAAGVRPVVIDEYYRAGGRLLGQVYEDRRKPAGHRLRDGAAEAAALEAELRSLDVPILTGRAVWDVGPGPTLRLSPGPDVEVRPRALILATGAIERAVPIPGWTLPGVMTIGAAQVLTNVHAVAPGDRVLVVGMDPLSLSVTGEMAALGVNVVAVVLPPAGAIAGARGIPASVIADLARASALAPSLALRAGGRIFGGRLSGLAARLARVELLRVWGVPLRLRVALTEIIGTDRVDAVRLTRIAPDGRLLTESEVVPVDAVCITGGLAPLSDLVRLSGCPVAEVPELGGAVPVHGPALETAAKGVFVAGNVVGIEGAPVAAAQGRLAAAGALRYLGARTGGDAEREIAAAREAVTEARRSSAFRFFAGIDDGHAYVERLWRGERPLSAPRATPHANGRADLVVCRCEEVTQGRIADALADGATAVAGVKKRTRACMGRCQGRVCEDVLRRLAAPTGQAELLRHRPRTPVRPIRLSDLAKGS